MRRLFVGAISGTSVDSLDLALINATETRPQIIAVSSVDLPSSLRAELAALAQPGTNEVYRAGRADAQLGRFIGDAVLHFLTEQNLRPTDIEAVGSHGQTIRHHPDSDPSFTVQIGNGSYIAEATQIDTVADFRTRDMAAGGEGAPLVPRFHDVMFRTDIDRTLVNLGGIANISVLAAEAGPDATQTTNLGFDTGPANALLDAWINAEKGQAYDADGAWAASGTVAPELLVRLLEHPYFDRPPPKSTGKELFNLKYIRTALARLERAPAATDVQTTLCEATAVSLARAINTWAPASGEIVLCGGGRRNRYLRQRIAEHLPQHRVIDTEEIDVDGDGLEAAAFAWLAKRFIDRQAGNASAATGAKGERVLGCLYPG